MTTLILMVASFGFGVRFALQREQDSPKSLYWIGIRKLLVEEKKVVVTDKPLPLTDKIKNIFKK